MKTRVRLVVEVELDDSLSPSNQEERDCLFNGILKEELLLHSNYLGCEIGQVTVVDVLEENDPDDVFKKGQ